jgi:hypothetical protein
MRTFHRVARLWLAPAVGVETMRLIRYAVAGCAAVPLTGLLIAAPAPASYSRLRVDDLLYVGAFRLPAASINGDDFSFGGSPIAFNPATNGLFIGTHSGKVAEIAIPDPVDSAMIADLPFAPYLQGFADPTEGHSQDVATDRANPASIDGLLVFGDRLYGTDDVYYDATASQRLSHYSRALSLAAPSFKGMYEVWRKGKAGFVSGYMALVPDDWQGLLGGSAITGQCCIPIVSRTSYGPSAFAWNPSELGSTSPTPATPLAYYPGEHPLAAWDSTNPVYNGSTEIHGAAIPAQTRTLLLVGRHGLGRFCYGTGGASGECADPAIGDKGNHGYPYAYQVWAYDLLDFAEVKAGRKRPWDVRPYDVWTFRLPIDEPGKHLGGVGYDSARRLLYVSQLWADADGYAHRPLIHVFRVR